jgi:hypothetical protein
MLLLLLLLLQLLLVVLLAAVAAEAVVAAKCRVVHIHTDMLLSMIQRVKLQLCRVAAATAVTRAPVAADYQLQQQPSGCAEI